MTANEVLQRWIEDANQGRIKDGTRELSNDELALVGSVLRAVAGDLLMSESLLAGLDEIITRAKSKTPCASNYECLLADLLGLRAGLAATGKETP